MMCLTDVICDHFRGSSSVCVYFLTLTLRCYDSNSKDRGIIILLLFITHFFTSGISLSSILFHHLSIIINNNNDSKYNALYYYAAAYTTVKSSCYYYPRKELINESRHCGTSLRVYISRNFLLREDIIMMCHFRR
jgi:hypothetical protein